jgi:hypothetical protein
MTEEELTLLPSFTKPSFVMNYSWDSSRALDYKFTDEINLPQVLNSFKGPSYVFLRLFALFRCSFQIRFQLNSTRFNSGRLICAFIPAVGNTRRCADRFQASGMPNVQIDAATSTVAEMTIPFASVQEFMTTNTSNDAANLGRICVIVMNPLFTVTGAPGTVNMSVYINPISPSLHMAMYDHDLALPTGITEALMTGASAIGAGFSGVQSLLAGNYSKGLGSISKGLAALGLDAPQNPVSDYNRVARGFPSHARAVGPMEDEVLSLIPGTTPLQVTDDYYSTRGDEMDVLKICQIPMLITYREWAVGDAPGKVLMSIPVSPLTCHGKMDAIPNAIWSPTFLAYCSAGYLYWKGSMHYRFEIVATQFHSGRLIAAFVPNDPKPAADLSLQQLTACPHVEFDLQTCKEFEMRIPYNTYTGRKITSLPYGQDVGEGPAQYTGIPCPFISVIDDTGFLKYEQAWRFASNPALNKMTTLMCNGGLVLAVQTALSTNNGVASTIQINVFQRAGEDFQLIDVRNPISGVEYRAPPTDVRRTLLEDDEEMAPTGAIDLESSRTDPEPAVPSTQVGDASIGSDVVLNNRNDMNLKVYLNRYFFLDYAYVKALPSTSVSTNMWLIGCNVTPLSSYPIGTGSYITPAQNPFCWYAMLYRFWSGSMRFNFVLPASKIDPTLMYSFHQPIAGSTQSELTGLDQARVATGDSQKSLYAESGGWLHTLSSVAYQNGISVSVPFRSCYDRLYMGLLNVGGPYISAINGFVAFFATNPSTQTPNGSSSTSTWTPIQSDYSVKAYYGAGDDFRMFYLLAPPRMMMKSQFATS